jgi:hypothetical protein
VNIHYIPLVRVMRDLHDLPRGYERFQQYLDTVLREDRSDVELLPLLAMNPMGREHVSAHLDELLAIDADSVAAAALLNLEPELADVPGDYRAGLVVVDDVRGGWTNRYDYEMRFRFGVDRLKGRPTRRNWIIGLLFVSEEVSAERVRQAIRAATLRIAYVHRHGHAATLRQMLAQEGWTMARAGCTEPALDADDLAYTREVLTPFLESEDLPTQMVCLLGLPASRSQSLGRPRPGAGGHQSNGTHMNDALPEVGEGAFLRAAYFEAEAAPARGGV